ncbi:MAG: helix-turn-helix transcriptional regulator [Ruminiclostridium sp.]|nr:helix-turn-helix transcriptional regulator [Ruminiclostridium sp.]
MEKKDIENYSIAGRLIKLLKWKGMSQYRLADSVGIHRSHLNKVIQSARSPKGTPKGLSDGVIRKIAKYFDIDYNFLKTGSFSDAQNISTRILLNTLEAFELQDFRTTDEEIYEMEEQGKWLEQNYCNIICDEINGLNDEDLLYMYHCLKAILSIEHHYYVFVNLVNQLNKEGVDKISRFMNTMTTSLEDCVTSFPLANRFFEAEMLFDAPNTYDIQKSSSVTRSEMIEVIKESVLAMDEEQSEMLFDHLKDVLTLNKSDWQMLKRFALLRTKNMVFSKIGYKIPVNHEMIFDYLECLIKVHPKKITEESVK